jgi:hypothetical protein
MATRQPKIPAEILGTPEESQQVDVAFEPERQRLAERQDARMALGEELRKSQALQAEQESKQKIAVKEAGVRATEGYVRDIEREQQQYRQQLSANPLPTHKPTQEDLSTYAQLGSLLMTMGLMIGAGGKGNAKAGLDAMTGMLNGWRKGRQDLWAQEAKNFEKAFNKVKADRDTIYKNLQEGMKLASTNYAAAKEKFETAAFIAGEGSIVAHRIRTGQLQQALKDMENVDKVWDEFNNKKRAAVSALAQARLQRELAEKQRAATIEAARIRAAGKGVGDERQKPTADITNKFDTTRDGLNSMTSVLEKLEGKVVKDNWEKGSVELRRFLAERPTRGREDTMLNQFIKQRAIQSLPAEVRELIITIAAARNDYYKSISGTAVSGNEATRNFGAIIQPSDNLEQLRSKASEIAKKQVNRLNEYVDSYSFAPALIRNAKAEVDRAKKYYEIVLPAGIPEGSRKIGKSPDGKDVYQAPDGEQYTPD